MAIAPTGAIYKSLSFDGKNSRDYGVYITGEAVYNAPERDVELVTIPGRNGSFALDNGRFENIEVTYPAGIFAYTEEDFRKAISDFRNLLCSRKGYVRLSDEYNPDEYRMAVYKSGLDVSPAQLKAGEFDITFDCKPQRFLVSGEEAVEIGVWGDTETESGSIVTIEADDTTAIKELTADIEPIQSGSGEPSPSNVRPISGHTDVVVSRTGKNLLDLSGEEIGNFISNNGTTSVYSGWNCSGYVSVRPNTTYTFTPNTTAGANAKHCFYDLSQTFIGYIDSGSATFTTPSNCYYMRFSYRDTSTNLQLELGSMATAYEAYQGDTYTIDLDGTRYGGTLDVTSGVLTVKSVAVDMGTLTWGLANSTANIFRTDISDMAIPTTRDASGIISSCFKISSTTGLSINMDDGGMLRDTSVARLYVRDTAYSNTAAFTSAVSGQTLVYELATPTTVQLTAEEIDLLLGQNNIWASSGDVTVEYGQDPNILVNPTLFDASPLLEVEGYGEIDINGNLITSNNMGIGAILLLSSIEDSSSGGSAFTTYQITRTFDATVLNNGDALQLGDITGITQHVMMPTIKSLSGSITSTSGVTVSCSSDTLSKRITISSSDLSFVYGTSKTVTGTATISVTITYTNNTTATSTITLTLIVAYDGSEEITVSINHPAFGPYQSNHNMGIKFSELTGYSTKFPSSDAAYIDLDIGEAWTENSGVIVPLNDAVILPANLPTLLSGSNTITFDNTITDLKIIPRWWKV